MSIRNTSISSANKVLNLWDGDLFPIPVEQFGFETDKMFSFDAIDLSETRIGADGRMVGGRVYSIVPMTLTYQPDSPSLDFINAIVQGMLTVSDIIWLSGTLVYPSINKAYSLNNGIIKNANIIPDALKTLAPINVSIHWESVTPAVL